MRLRDSLKFGSSTALELQGHEWSGVADQTLQVELKSARTVAVVSDFDRLVAMHPDWDGFVDSFASSPFFLMGMLKAFFRPGDNGSHPFAVVMSEGNEPVGLAVFRMMGSYIFRKPRLFRFRSVEFLLPYYWSPDFVVRPEHREEFVEGVLTVIFDTLGCRSASLTLPSDSPNAPVLRKWCEGRAMVIQSFSGDKHAVLTVHGTWHEFLESMEKDYVRKYKKFERRLASAGKLGISSGRVDSQAIVEKIMEVDRNSWKQEWKKRRSADTDERYDSILDYYHSGSKFCPLFWLLELDGKPIAFSVTTILGGVAYMIKTSYDERYKYFSPGNILNNMAIRDLFESGRVSRMDFFTLHDYMRPWTSEIQRRETFIIENHKGPFKLLTRLKRSKGTAQAWRAVTRLRQRLLPLQRAGTVRDYDLRQIIAIEKASFPDFSSFPDFPSPRATFDRLRQDPEGKFIMARKDGRVVGYLASKVQGDRAHILSIAVATNYRRRGIGEAMLRKSIDRSIYARRVKRVFLEVSSSNKAALSLYHKLSFKETEVIKKFYPNGEDAIEMERTV